MSTRAGHTTLEAPRSDAPQSEGAIKSTPKYSPKRRCCWLENCRRGELAVRLATRRRDEPVRPLSSSATAEPCNANKACHDGPGPSLPAAKPGHEEGCDGNRSNARLIEGEALLTGSTTLSADDEEELVLKDDDARQS